MKVVYHHRERGPIVVFLPLGQWGGYATVAGESVTNFLVGAQSEIEATDGTTFELADIERIEAIK